MTEQIDVKGAEPSPLFRAFAIIFAVLIGIFTLGMIGGFAYASIERGSASWKGIAIVVPLALLLGYCSWWLLRKGVAGDWLPRSPRQRANRLVLYSTMAVGVVAGILLQIGEQEMGGSTSFLGYDTPLDPAVAIGLLATLPVIAWLYYRWHQSADEHDQAAYNFGGMLSLYTYFFASIGWWIAWRGGLADEPDGFAIFWAVIIVWSLGWVWKRFR
ncbi:hypothetical protein [Novosphingobium sp. TH158]|uniref:hypothetical protein n=1 Tax=Novosphingobium sp. TH158 TaxID=2067455 RepID=UPI000C7D94FE|nr:hypothetical protein [Novosphingobium sp. TH158]PLK25931.1 hypothetical protein C0V78_02755 [Novosphingobium sp. TH158]